MTTKLTLKDLDSKIVAQEELIIDLMKQVQELNHKIKALEEEGPKRNRGPKSQNPMTNIIAWRIRYGDRSTHSVKDNAEFFNLSRGQVYSLDKYTFQHIDEDSYNEESPEFLKSVEEFGS